MENIQAYVDSLPSQQLRDTILECFRWLLEHLVSHQDEVFKFFSNRSSINRFEICDLLFSSNFGSLEFTQLPSFALPLADHEKVPVNLVHRESCFPTEVPIKPGGIYHDIFENSLFDTTDFGEIDRPPTPRTPEIFKRKQVGETSVYNVDIFKDLEISSDSSDLEDGEIREDEQIIIPSPIKRPELKSKESLTLIKNKKPFHSIEQHFSSEDEDYVIEKGGPSNLYKYPGKRLRSLSPTPRLTVAKKEPRVFCKKPVHKNPYKKNRKDQKHLTSYGKRSLSPTPRLTVARKEAKKTYRSISPPVSVKELRESKRSSNGTIPCPRCMKPFTTVSNRNRHLKTMHGQSKMSKNKCNECDAQFKRKSDLKDHEKIHDAKFLGWICEVCDRIFKQRQRRDEHIRRIHKTCDLEKRKLHKCKFCSGTFGIKAQRNEHMKNCMLIGLTTDSSSESE